ncbi:MAG: hypothetical protein WC631_02085 [Candidatus Paceibacterota bacterium]|jgi:hypothetical protein
MNAEKPPQVTEQEKLEIEKELFKDSWAIRVGQSVADYKAEMEAAWNKMHPEKKETVEVVADGEESPSVREENDEQERIKAEESENKRQGDLNRVRQELGLDTLPEQISAKKNGEEKLLEKFDEFSQKALEKLKGDKDRVATYLGLQKLFQEMRRSGSREKITEYVLKESYSQKRKAEYTFDPNYEKAWNLATADDSLPRKEEGNWVFRGNFTSKERKTVTRGSLNITVTEDAVRDLDSLIKRGIIDANYKFGEPGVETEAMSRHDAVTVYFLTEPTPEAIKALSEVADKYYRGDDLLGKKISKGFYMSEFGSVSDNQARELVQKIDELDPEIGKAVKSFLTGQKGRVAMSEAQFYSVKETLNLLGIDI